MYKALVYFRDAQDKGYVYNVGDTYPRDGLVVREERLRELLSAENRRGLPVIEEIAKKPAEPVEEPVEEPKPRRRKKNAD